MFLVGWGEGGEEWGVGVGVGVGSGCVLTMCIEPLPSNAVMIVIDFY